MTKSKAIEILKIYRRDHISRLAYDTKDAFSLGIEALERLSQKEQINFAEFILPLPSETPEGVSP